MCDVINFPVTSLSVIIHFCLLVAISNCVTYIAVVLQEHVDDIVVVYVQLEMVNMLFKQFIYYIYIYMLFFTTVLITSQQNVI